MDIDAYVKTRPFAYHLTARANLARLRAHRRLTCARDLMRLGEYRESGTRRPESIDLRVGGERVVIRDQRPLTAANIAFDPGWDLEKLVMHLDGFVYFWPGTIERPIRHGRNHHARYRHEALAILRMRTDALFAVNAPPRFSAYNSGAPRMSGGRRSPRGADTFALASDFPRPPGRVVELVFESRADLPSGAEWAPSLDGSWETLWP